MHGMVVTWGTVWRRVTWTGPVMQSISEERRITNNSFCLMLNKDSLIACFPCGFLRQVCMGLGTVSSQHFYGSPIELTWGGGMTAWSFHSHWLPSPNRVRLGPCQLLIEPRWSLSDLWNPGPLAPQKPSGQVTNHHHHHHHHPWNWAFSTAHIETCRASCWGCYYMYCMYAGPLSFLHFYQTDQLYLFQGTTNGLGCHCPSCCNTCFMSCRKPNRAIHWTWPIFIAWQPNFFMTGIAWEQCMDSAALDHAWLVFSSVDNTHLCPRCRVTHRTTIVWTKILLRLPPSSGASGALCFACLPLPACPSCTSRGHPTGLGVLRIIVY